jgi:hypothetical protein
MINFELNLLIVFKIPWNLKFELIRTILEIFLVLISIIEFKY